MVEILDYGWLVVVVWGLEVVVVDLVKVDVWKK